MKNKHCIMTLHQGNTDVQLLTDSELEELFTEEQRQMLREGDWIIVTNKKVFRSYPHQATVVDLVANARHDRPYMFNHED